jgi:lysophospholipid acyltransferase (LPLAT)-like uncharacterized protein
VAGSKVARKRVQATRFFLALGGSLLRVYRGLIFAGYLLRHDERLRALLRSRSPAVFACWHQDFPQTLGYLSLWNPRRRTFALASASRDGGMAAAGAEAMGFQKTVRGSSAGGGASALRKLQRLAASGRPTSVAIVADGPRPPARDLKPGVLHLARETGLPLWLVRTSWHPDPSLSRTWARFHLPVPWARGVVVADGPIHVDPGLDRDGLERLRAEVGARLNALAERGDRLAVEVHGKRTP